MDIPLLNKRKKMTIFKRKDKSGKMYINDITNCLHLMKEDETFEAADIQIKEAVELLKNLIQEKQGIILTGDLFDSSNNLTISHMCDNHIYTDIPCINPFHTYFATKEEQMKDLQNSKNKIKLQ